MVLFVLQKREATSQSIPKFELWVLSGRPALPARRMPRHLSNLVPGHWDSRERAVKPLQLPLVVMARGPRRSRYAVSEQHTCAGLELRLERYTSLQPASRSRPMGGDVRNARRWDGEQVADGDDVVAEKFTCECDSSAGTGTITHRWVRQDTEQYSIHCYRRSV